MNMTQASIVGSGPNGLSAAIVLAQEGLSVDVYEAQAELGGAARTLPLTLPGFLNDFGSAVHPMAAGSPYFSTLPLQQYGLRWIHSPAVLAHPLDDGSAVVVEKNLDQGLREWGEDGASWQTLLQPFVENWSAFAGEVLGPVLHVPDAPLLLARFAANGIQPANFFARHRFKSTRIQSMFAGLAAHSALSLKAPLSAAAGIMFGAALYGPGWPIPAGGAQSITNALAAYLRDLRGTLHTSRRITDLSQLADTITLCDVSPRQLESIAGNLLTPAYRSKLLRFRQGPGAFKIDCALSDPVPWRATDCLRAATVHLGGSLEEIVLSEEEMTNGRHAERPFVLLVRPSLFDPTRAPVGKHTIWAYCHVPNGSTVDMTRRIEDQIERFAPGFRDCVLARRVFRPADLEEGDANLIGGDVLGGSMDLWQLLRRPTLRKYATSDPHIFLCSASTPPGGGVHGMCGYHAATMALRNLSN